jgi:hypothetical protein
LENLTPLWIVAQWESLLLTRGAAHLLLHHGDVKWQDSGGVVTNGWVSVTTRTSPPPKQLYAAPRSLRHVVMGMA